MKVLEEQVQLAQVVVLKVEEVLCDPWELDLKAKDRFPAAVERAQHERLTRLVVRRRKKLRAPALQVAGSHYLVEFLVKDLDE